MYLWYDGSPLSITEKLEIAIAHYAKKEIHLVTCNLPKAINLKDVKSKLKLVSDQFVATNHFLFEGKENDNNNISCEISRT